MSLQEIIKTATSAIFLWDGGLAVTVGRSVIARLCEAISAALLIFANPYSFSINAGNENIKLLKISTLLFLI